MSESHQELRSFVERVERLESEIKELNSDKSDVYAEAKGRGFDVKALKTVIARRRKDPSELSEHESLVETYEAALASGTDDATRVRARDADLEVATSILDATKKYAAVSGADGLDIPPFLDRRASA